MARSSPGVRRVAAILDFIADHPGQSFTLTDLVKALKLSRATCHALLTGLVEVGYLYRASDKNYVLGPRLAAVGRIAAQHASPLQVAQPEMRALADEFEAVCGAFFRDGNEIVVRDRASSHAHVGWSVPIGSRLKLRPSSAAIFFASSPQAELDAWLSGYSPPPSPEQRAELLNGLAFVREHGYLPIMSDPGPAAAERSLEQALHERNSEFPTSSVTLLTKLNDDQSYRLASIVAPVFDVGGKVAFALDISVFDRLVSASDIKRMGARLCAAGDRITTFITGRPPQPATAKA